MSGGSRTLEDMLAVAARQNLDVRFPEPNELFLDIDCDADLMWMERQLVILRENGFGECPARSTPSKRGGERCHVVVTLNREVTAIERILLQACLGSDRKHELLSFIESPTNEKPTCFFEKRPHVQPLHGDLDF